MDRPASLRSRLSYSSLRSVIEDPKTKINFYLIWIVIVACMGPLQFGYHLGELNATERVLSCKVSLPKYPIDYKDTIYGRHGLQQCIPMESRSFALVTTMLAIGGLLGSLFAGNLANQYGRHKVCFFNTALYFIGSSTLIFANSIKQLCVGRLIAGFGAGSALVVCPMLINEITPVSHRGIMGTMMQFFVSFGILLSQLVSFYWANDQEWRHMFTFVTILSIVNFLLLLTIPESPKWLITSRNDFDTATTILRSIRYTNSEVEYELYHWKQLIFPSYTKYDVDETTQLLPIRSRRGSLDTETSAIPMSVFLTNKAYRREMIAVVLVMTSSQLTGMNSITFYGVSVLSAVISSSVLFINLMLSLVNLTSVGIASPLVDALGRRPMLLFSIGIMGISSAILGVSLTFGWTILAFTSVFTFVAGYSLGLGPIPFLIISEMTEHHCIGAAQSFGTFLNWGASIMIGFFFPILQDMLGGYVFLIFTTLCFFYFIATYKLVPETKGKTDYSEVWENFSR